MLPAGVVLTGGGSKLEGIGEMIKDILRLPTIVGKPAIELSGVVDNVSDPVYSTSAGLALWGIESGNASQSKKPLTPELSGLMDKAKNMFKNFLP
jgi:cell division protein FtsA